MRRRAIVLSGLAATVAAFVVATPTTAAPDKEVLLTAELTGEAVVQGGDPDGSGSATILVDPKDGVACFDVATMNVATPITGRIQSGSAGASGPPVAFLFENQESPVRGCVTADRKSLREIARQPESFYLNVVNDEFPVGAVRGQWRSQPG